MILPCERMIIYLHIKEKDIKNFMKKNFKINVDESDVQKIIEKIPKKPEKSILKSRSNSKIKEFEKRVGMHSYDKAIDSLVKIADYPRLLYFINTAIYRKLDVEVIKDVVNSIFTDEEISLIFTTEELEYYRLFVFDFSEMNNYYRKKFVAVNEDIADFSNKLAMSQVANVSDIYIALSPDKVVSDILNVSFHKAMGFLKSMEREDIRLGKVLADFAIKNLKDTREIIGDVNENEMDKFTVEFEKNNAQKPVLIDDLDKVSTSS